MCQSCIVPIHGSVSRKRRGKKKWIWAIRCWHPRTDAKFSLKNVQRILGDDIHEECTLRNLLYKFTADARCTVTVRVPLCVRFCCLASASIYYRHVKLWNCPCVKGGQSHDNMWRRSVHLEYMYNAVDYTCSRLAHFEYMYNAVDYSRLAHFEYM